MSRSASLFIVLGLSISGSLLAADNAEQIVLVGDSTVATHSGWGDSFGKMLKSDVKWVNLARGGRSSKSYRDEGWWKQVLDSKPTWVFIQFGHNDQPGKGPKRETDPQTTFRENLTRYANEARQAGAKPVLVTSLTRRLFDNDGKIDPERLEPVSIPKGFRLTDYAEATRAVAEELDVPLIDLNRLSVRHMNRLGPEAAKRFDPGSKTPEHPDKTHLNSYGAALTAQLVVGELCHVVPEFAPLLKTRLSWNFVFTDGDVQEGGIHVAPQTAYESEQGYGFVSSANTETPALFDVNLVEANYEVTMQFGHSDHSTSTTIKAEARRLMLENVETKAGEYMTRSFTVNVRRPPITPDRSTKLNSRETGPPMHLNWDDQLSFEFNGTKPGVVSMMIRPSHEAITVFIAGDSTVTDQRTEPYAGWGQMLPRFFGPSVAVSNHAESGLALRSFEYQLRLEKLLSMMKPDDYVFIQFGHNDQKDNRDGAGPFSTYKNKLSEFVDVIRAKRGIPVLVTSMERLRMDENGNQTPTLTDYAEAVRQVGKDQNVPVIDLNVMSLKFYAALGPKRSTKAFAFYPAGTLLGQEKELKDRTHHNSYGAYQLARCVVEGIQKHVPELAKHLAKDAERFDPAKPDDPLTFDLPSIPTLQLPKKPAGN
ncbi:Rhamnogalacturonan acetylesterase RhgT [Planctomycetes bacterium CA13]|uniref:Rhamnogalacturonan acetylesterase RhgT n=1 Tax=Novipirellula herctigrandis TaxID=2527986 RepID=A0A5C5ZCY3_9BACT|nr:Rhamnogalacturonan acetylesterase RhgT [Planctomycetes bacterium CA13]